MAFDKNLYMREYYKKNKEKMRENNKIYQTKLPKKKQQFGWKPHDYKGIHKEFDIYWMPIYRDKNRHTMYMGVIENKCGHYSLIFKGALIRYRKKFGINYIPNCSECASKLNRPPLKYRDKHYNWHGGFYKSSEGYNNITIYEDDPLYKYAVITSGRGSNKSGRRMRYCRYLYMKITGEILKPYEEVHHINGIKDDDRMENYEKLPHRDHGVVTKMQRYIKKLELQLSGKV
jgi:hypothetical protein